MRMARLKFYCASADGDKDSDGPSESGDNTSESTQGAPSEPTQEKGSYACTLYIINYVTRMLR